METAEGLLQQKLLYVYQSLILLLPNIVAGLVVLALFWFGAWFAERTIKRAFHQRRQFDLGDLLGGFVRWGTIGLGVLVAATIIFPSVKPGDVLATLGIGSVAIGFAFKDILQNWFAGLLILLRQPFRRGDQIVVGSFEGTVEHIQARATSIKTYDGRRVVIPNSDLYTQAVTVNTAFPTVRSSYDVGIGYADDIEAARSAILGALDGLEGIKVQPRTRGDPVGPRRLLGEPAGALVDGFAAHRRRPGQGPGDRGGPRRVDRRAYRHALPDAGDAVPRPDRGDRRRPRPSTRGLAARRDAARLARGSRA